MKRKSPTYYYCPHLDSCRGSTPGLKPCKNCLGMVRGAVQTHTRRMDLHPFCQQSCPVHKLIEKGRLLDDFPFISIDERQTHEGSRVRQGTPKTLPAANQVAIPTKSNLGTPAHSPQITPISQREGVLSHPDVLLEEDLIRPGDIQFRKVFPERVTDNATIGVQIPRNTSPSWAPMPVKSPRMQLFPVHGHRAVNESVTRLWGQIKSGPAIRLTN
ncbi:hypothetical protein MJO28_003066 [Puccinia striiformis f. sp. tritici]|uniref:Uncharacterized protein n=1 Tax=Puccinia striiformis f. sp. tritici TaxID=168172 RepID=A0ACC0ERP1_9BASI|nr:hypothetical protein MJO28_003066 [Puccinia striiformis f. sp. tritici]